MSLIIREPQVKTTMSYHFAPVGTALTKERRGNVCRRECGEMETGAATTKNNMVAPQMRQRALTYDP